MPRKRHIEPAPISDESVAAVYTITELAARWRASRHTITAAIRAGRLQAFKVGDRQYRIREAEVVRYENEQMGRAAS